MKAILEGQVKSNFTQEDADNRYIKLTEKGLANGVATLGSDSKIPSSQLPAMDYIPTSQKGVAGGVATLGSDGKIPSEQMSSGDYFTKAQSLQATTAALYGLPASAVPDDVLAFLGKYNQYWWKRSIQGVSESSAGTYKLCEASYSDNTRYVTIAYSSSIAIQNGAIELSGDIASISIGYATNYNTDVLNGKYFKYQSRSGGANNGDLDPENVYIGKSNVSRGQNYGSGIYFAQIQAAIVSAGPSSVVEYIQSSDRNAYPDSGESGGYVYQFLGIPFDNAATAPQIVTGSYTGTGTYGSNNKNNVYVGFYPKLFIVYGTESTMDFWFFRCAAMSETDQSGMYGQVDADTGYDFDDSKARFVPDNGGGIRWWYQGVGGSSTSYAAGQLNTSGKIYYYVAIG